ncbi:MAG: Rap1a/Tai family immunity protein [Gammaproteobacteria bacterium]|nr:Rap1a/Tai family immunity protein [Gammaproteobacteria bacterium]
MKLTKNFWLIVCVNAGLILSFPLGAQSVEQAPDEEVMLTGAELLENCQPEAGGEAPTAYCMEFVFGLVRTISGLQEMMPEAEKVFCIDPNRVGLKAVTNNVTDWLEAHPGRLEEPAFLLVSEALRDALSLSRTGQ